VWITFVGSAIQLGWVLCGHTLFCDLRILFVMLSVIERYQV